MASIEVDDEGLSRLARLCETQAVRLGKIATPPVWVDALQPSGAAVGTAHAAIAAAAARLTDRMMATAVAAAAAYKKLDMSETHSFGGNNDAEASVTRLRDQLLYDAVGDCLPLAHVDSVAGRVAADSVSARQDLLMRTVRRLIDDGLMVVGNIVGASDERVEPWDMSLDDAMARIYDETSSIMTIKTGSSVGGSR
jgi:hypothetical protein